MLQKSGLEAQSAGMAVIRVMNNIMAGSTVAKVQNSEATTVARFDCVENFVRDDAKQQPQADIGAALEEPRPFVSGCL